MMRKQVSKLCRACQRHLAWLKHEHIAGGSWCSVCGFWRWDGTTIDINQIGGYNNDNPH
jgi:hypothetical protein